MSEIRERRANVSLSCGHDAMFSPPPIEKDVVYCWLCQGYYVVIGGQASQRVHIIVVCEECSYERKFRTDVAEHRARITADTHRVKTGHAVHVIGADGRHSYRTVPCS